MDVVVCCCVVCCNNIRFIRRPDSRPWTGRSRFKRSRDPHRLGVDDAIRRFTGPARKRAASAQMHKNLCSSSTTHWRRVARTAAQLSARSADSIVGLVDVGANDLIGAIEQTEKNVRRSLLCSESNVELGELYPKCHAVASGLHAVCVRSSCGCIRPCCCCCSRVGCTGRGCGTLHPIMRYWLD